MLRKLGFVFLVLFIAVSLFASEGEKQVYGTIGLTYNPDFGTLFSFGGGVFFALSDKLGIDYEYTYAPDIITKELREFIDSYKGFYKNYTISSRMAMFNVDLVYQFKDLNKGFAPYITVGPVFVMISGKATGVSIESKEVGDNFFGVSFGGGIKLAPLSTYEEKKNFLIRADYRFYSLEGGQLFHRITGAVGYRFLPAGEPKREKQGHQVYTMFGVTYNPDLDDDPGFGGGVFLAFNDKLGSQFEVTYGHSLIPPARIELMSIVLPEEVDVSVSYQMVFINGDIVYQFRKLEEGFAPYVAAGAGMMMKSVESTISYAGGTDSESVSDSFFTLDLGGGVKVPLGEGLLLRADYRVFYVFFEEEMWLNKWFHRATGAVGYRF